MEDASDSRGRILDLLEAALALADEINDGDTGYAIERALDAARAQAFRPFLPHHEAGYKGLPSSVFQLPFQAWFGDPIGSGMDQHRPVSSPPLTVLD
jgi:hypothetical protein